MAVSQMDVIQQQILELQRTVNDASAQLLIASKSVAHQSERVIIMVDRSNLDQTWRRIENGGLRPDYVKLKDFLGDGRAIKQMRLYYSDIDADMVADADRVDWQRRQDFYSFLRHQGWILRGVRKKIHDGIPTEKGLDGALIRDMEIICRDNRCDTIALVAGDADYCDVVTDVQERYCMKVEVAFFPNQTARDLRAKAAKFIDLECAKDRITRRPTER